MAGNTNNYKLFGSLFSGGGGMDLGLEQAGLKCTFQVENDKHCLTLLERHWPNVPKNQIRPCVGLVGGDPCPVRSPLGKQSGSKSADMSGYFLAMAARIKPRWILRENVPAPDVIEFKAALEMLGYHSIVVQANSKVFTGQNRPRDFLVSFSSEAARNRFEALVRKEVNQHTDSLLHKEQRPFACLVKRGRSGASVYDNFIYEGAEWGLRSPSHTERELLQGWPIGWTDGLPHTARERITGNGVTAPLAEWIGINIVKAFELLMEMEL